MYSILTTKDGLLLTVPTIGFQNSTMRVAQWTFPDTKHHYVTDFGPRLTSVSEGDEEGTLMDTSNNYLLTVPV